MPLLRPVRRAGPGRHRHRLVPGLRHRRRDHAAAARSTPAASCSIYIYQQAFTESDFGYGSALAVILFVILALVAFIQMKFLKGNESDLD